jgi:hypothetical protein
MSPSRDRYEHLRASLCPRCPIRRTCFQTEEQLDACADAVPLIHDAEELAPLTPSKDKD